MTETRSVESFEANFKCELLLEMRTDAPSSSEIGLRLQISGRRPATLTAYEAALTAGEGICEALRTVGQLQPSEDPDYLSEIDTGQDTRACLSDFRSVAEAWTVSGDWYFYFLPSIRQWPLWFEWWPVFSRFVLGWLRIDRVVVS